MLGNDELRNKLSVFQIQLNAWYAGLLSNPSGVRSLAELIAFDNANPTLEEPTGYTSQSE